MFTSVWRTDRPRPSARKFLSLRCRLTVEVLEDRLALSWGSVPPATVTPPTGALAVSLNSQGDAQGTAAITNNEIDWYTYVVPTTGSYRLAALTPTSDVDTVLGVYNGSGQRLAYNDDISSSNRDSQLTVSLQAGTRVYFGITNYIGTPGGGYTWQVDGPAGDDRYEENDTLAQATNLGSLTGRRTLTGLVMADSQDWFRFQMAGAGTSEHSVAITFTHAQGDLDFRLYDGNGTLLRLSDGVTNEERISLNGLAAGTYFVQVYGYNGARNPNYTLDINPAVSSGGSGSSRILYLNFDGAVISRTDLVRWAGSDWAGSVDALDADGNGISVQPFLRTRGDREQIISRLMQLVQDDLRPFGITVQRHTGLAVENQNATTIFLGPSTLSNNYYHVACEVDQGNNNRTDIAFVGNEDWGTVERTALALADVTLHEAGHTYGLWHVSSGNELESMGLRYSVNDGNLWVQNTSFLDRTFVEYVDPNGYRHGPGPQNSYRSMLQAFGTGTSGAPAGAPVQTDASRNGVFALVAGAQADQVEVRRLARGAIEVTVNGQVYELAPGFREVHVYTQGDERDQVRAVNNLGGVRLQISRGATAYEQDQGKLDGRLAAIWNGSVAQERDHGHGCGCEVCRGSVGMGRVLAEVTEAAGSRMSAVPMPAGASVTAPSTTPDQRWTREGMQADTLGRCAVGAGLAALPGLAEADDSGQHRPGSTGARGLEIVWELVPARLSFSEGKLTSSPLFG